MIKCYECESEQVVGCVETANGVYRFLCRKHLHNYSNSDVPPEQKAKGEIELTPLQALEKLSPKKAKKKIVFHRRGRNE